MSGIPIFKDDGTKDWTKVVPLDLIRTSQSLAVEPPVLPPTVVPPKAQEALDRLLDQGRNLIVTFL